MSSRFQVYLFALIFIVFGASLTVYKSQVLGFPLTPGEDDTVWDIEARVSLDPMPENSIKATLALPNVVEPYALLSESFSSSGFGFDTGTLPSGQRRVVWTKRQGRGQQQLYYRLVIAEVSGQPKQHFPPSAVPVEPPEWLDAERDVALSLIGRATELSADTESLPQQLLLQLNSKQSIDASFLLQAFPDASKAELALRLLAETGIHARRVRGVTLENDRRNVRAEEMIEIWNDEQWIFFDPVRARQGQPRNFLGWQRGDISLLEVVGGEQSQIRFSMLRNRVPSKQVALQTSERQQVPLIDFSIFSLPLETQHAFKSILLVPVGILLVAIFRILVGLRTSGTFMPVLIALALIETKLGTGLATFLTIVGVGLWLRSYLSRINLLLVARISVVVIMVIILMASFSVINHKLGVDDVLAITFFPMIIIAWTIERMSILWEEDGAKEVLIQGGGSLLVAVVTYLCMTNAYVTHLTFNVPEILFIEAGLILLMGQYSGYRLSEFYRFRFLSKD
ncbi:MAG: UUP1 family membrane protein [Motiliproteus sp.]